MEYHKPYSGNGSSLGVCEQISAIYSVNIWDHSCSKVWLLTTLLYYTSNSQQNEAHCCCRTAFEISKGWISEAKYLQRSTETSNKHFMGYMFDVTSGEFVTKTRDPLGTCVWIMGQKNLDKTVEKNGLPALGQQNGLDRWVRTTDRLRKCKNIEFENFGQSGTLRHLLFLLYINDFSKCSNVFDFHIFADDTNLFYSNSNLAELESIVTYNLKMVSDWLMANKVSLNIDKTNFINFHPPQKGEGKESDPNNGSADASATIFLYMIHRG